MVIALLGLFLRWPYPEPGWIHIDERVFLLNPLKLWSGDLNPHFFIYPTLHIYLTSALYYLYYALLHAEPVGDFVAYYFFVDGGELLMVARGFNSVLSMATALVVAHTGRRLYGLESGLLAGLFFAALPLSVRFAHMATTDSPAVLWVACALFFAVRVVQEGKMRDFIWAGICVGLAGGTKYPAALVAVPVAVAGLLRTPSLWQGGVWAAGGAAILTFAAVSPYVVLDAGSAWEDLALMGRVHLGSGEAKAEIPSWLYYLQYGLRYGVGLVGLAGLAIGLVWRPTLRRREEWVVVAAFGTFLALLLAAESVFMRYVLPLAPMVALLWVRPLRPWHRVATPLLALALLAEPLYASWQTRRLLAGGDTREQAEELLAREAPHGAWIVNLPPFIGNIRMVHPGSVFSHERRFLLSYGKGELIEAYGALSQRRDLPPLQLTLKPEALKSARTKLGGPGLGRAFVLWYQHAAIPPVAEKEAQALLHDVRWMAEFAPGREGGIYEAIDWYFVPIGGFGVTERTGPSIRVGEVPLQSPAPTMGSAEFFGVLHGILLGAEKVQAEDWQGAAELFEEIWRTPLPLYRILSSDYFYTYLFNYGVAHDKLGRPEQAATMWRLALELRDDSPVLHQNMGVAYARQGHLVEAQRHLQRALELDADYAEAHFNLGNIQFQHGEIYAALETWTTAVAIDARHAGAWQGLGNVHYERRDWTRALAAYRRARGLDPGNASILFNMAQVHLEQENTDSAIGVLREAIALAPRDAEAHFLLGMVYRQSGQKDEARLSLSTALELEPQHPRAAQISAYLKQGL